MAQEQEQDPQQELQQVVEQEEPGVGASRRRRRRRGGTRQPSGQPSPSKARAVVQAREARQEAKVKGVAKARASARPPRRTALRSASPSTIVGRSATASAAASMYVGSVSRRTAPCTAATTSPEGARTLAGACLPRQRWEEGRRQERRGTTQAPTARPTPKLLSLLVRVVKELAGHTRLAWYTPHPSPGWATLTRRALPRAELHPLQVGVAMYRVMRPGHRWTNRTGLPKPKGSSLLDCIPRAKGSAGAGVTQGTTVSKNIQQERRRAAASFWNTQSISVV